MKGTRKPLPCPVAALLLLPLLTGCGGGGEPGPAPLEAGPPLESGRTAILEPTGEFQFTPAPPETVEVTWRGGGPAEVVSAAGPAGTVVAPGDTLLLLEEGLGRVELQRLDMELRLEQALLAANPSDGSARIRAESLSVLLDSLEASSRVPVTSPVGGLLLALERTAGDAVTPGALLARISVGPESLFVVRPPAGIEIVSWPAGSGSLTLVEEEPPSALYYGVPAPDGEFSDLFAVPRDALFEEGLRTFVVTAVGDTLETLRVGSSGDRVLVQMPLGEAGMEVRTWGSASP